MAVVRGEIMGPATSFLVAIGNNILMRQGDVCAFILQLDAPL